MDAFCYLIVQFWPHLDLSSLREWGRCVWKYKADPEYKALTVIQTPCRLFASTTNPPFRTIRCNATVFCWTIWFHSLPAHAQSSASAVFEYRGGVFCTNSGLNGGNLQLLAKAKDIVWFRQSGFFAGGRVCWHGTEGFLILSVSAFHIRPPG